MQKKVEEENLATKTQDEPEATVAEKAEEKAITSQDDKKEAPELKDPEKNPQKKFETTKRPYDCDALFKEVEEDLENMMDEMRVKIRK